MEQIVAIKSRTNRRRQLHCGFTLVELLVVIAIIGILVALLLPAIQAAREAARRNSCKNKVKQMALGWMNHESTVGHFPTGGWGFKWVGDGDRGLGDKQPGGWIYNILPFIEQQALHDMPSDGKPDVLTTQQKTRAREMMDVPFDTIHCPSRTTDSGLAKNNARYFNMDPVRTGDVVPGTDYAANTGDRPFVHLFEFEIPRASDFPNPGLGRVCLEAVGTYRCGSGGTKKRFVPAAPYWAQNVDPEDNVVSGVCFDFSKIKLRHITDGASNTYMLGEKWAEDEQDDSSAESGSNQPWSGGGSDDQHRSGAYAPLMNARLDSYPDGTLGLDLRFGGPHSGGFNMAFCDGHVEMINFDVDLFVHQTQANRFDGQVFNNQ